MSRHKQNGPLDLPFHVRLILFAVGVLLFVGAMALFEVNLIFALILFTLGIFSALTGVGYSRKDRSPGGFEGTGHQRMTSQYGKMTHSRKEDVPFNPWDTVSASKSHQKKQEIKEPWEKP